MTFKKGAMVFVNMYKENMELTSHGERYITQSPPISVHNLIIGTPYLDVGGKHFVRNAACPKDQYVEIDYFKKGWSSENQFKVTATVCKAPGQAAYKIEGRWSESLTLTNLETGESEVVWTKNPYPETWEYQYGFGTY